MPYRTELKRPDLKGQFPCSVCHKIFCHSSSLSRHRMQAHFKSYTCTQCNQEISSELNEKGSETLRSHMFRYHQISRMFMCRCCNWAFPDKTSLHIHMTTLSKTGQPGDVAVLARSSVEGELIPFDEDHIRMLMEDENVNSTSSSPREYRDNSASPMSQELKMSSASPSDTPSMVVSNNNNNSSCYTLENNTSNNLVFNSFVQNETMKALANEQQNQMNGIFPPMVCTPNRNELLKKIKQKSKAADLNKIAKVSPAKLGQLFNNNQEAVFNNNNLVKIEQSPNLTQNLFADNQWLAQWLANNPILAASGADGLTGKEKNSAILIQALAAAAHVESLVINSPNRASPQGSKKARINSKRSRSPLKNFSFKNTPETSKDNSMQKLNISVNSGGEVSRPDPSPAGKLNSVINKISSRAGAGNEVNETFSGESNRRNKRKARVPQQLSDSEVIGLVTKQEVIEDVPMANIKLEDHPTVVSHPFEQAEQPSPAVSDSQTSGSSHLEIMACDLATSPKKCINCEVTKSKLDYNESRIKEFQDKIDTLLEKSDVSKVAYFQFQIESLKKQLSSIARTASEAAKKLQEENDKELWQKWLKEIAEKAAVSNDTTKIEPKFNLEEEEEDDI